ncbi:MAG: LacI family DNA-binding transcriptional regulator [Thermoflexales bacterium]|nr:LacI family DNA-binding transcriptional regulator [Thermoflexales bacterium]
MTATLRDVAKRAKVSVKTASRVLNDEASVADATRAKVLKAIRDLGYVANLSARRLATGSAFTIGLVFQNASWHYILDVQRAVLETARPAGYHMILQPFDAASDVDADSVLQLFTQHIVDGFIFTPPADNASQLLDRLSNLDAPFVRLTPFDRSSVWPYVSATDQQGAHDMTQYLLSLGHTRLGYVMGPIEQKAAHDRLAGYQAALAEAHLKFDPALVKQGRDHFESGAAAGRELLAMTPRPSAIFCNNDEMAAGVMAAVFEQGLRVPEDVSVAGFDDIPLSRQIWPSLTTVRQPIYQIAQTATEILLRLLNGEEPGDVHIEFPTELVIRTSTQPYLPH